MRPTRLQKTFLEALNDDFCHDNDVKMIKYGSKFGYICPKKVHKNCGEFKPFLLLHYSLTTYFNFVIRKTQPVVKDGLFSSQHEFVPISCPGLRQSRM